MNWKKTYRPYYFQHSRKHLYADILPCPKINDHDTPYIIANMPVNKFETRYKYMKNFKNFEVEKHVHLL